MSKRKEKQKRRLRRLIHEACGPQPREGMPCPIATANKIKSTGTTPDEFMAWVSELIDNYNSGAELQKTSTGHNPLASIAVERYQHGGDKKLKPSKSSLRIGSTIFGVGFGS